MLALLGPREMSEVEIPQLRAKADIDLLAISCNSREPFFIALARELNGHLIGDGLLHRCIAAAQKKFAKATGGGDSDDSADAWAGRSKAAGGSWRLDKLLAGIRTDAFQR